MPYEIQYGTYKIVKAFSMGVSYVSANASLNVSLKVPLLHTLSPQTLPCLQIFRLLSPCRNNPVSLKVTLLLPFLQMLNRFKLCEMCVG